MSEQAVLCLWVNYMDGPLFYKENLWYFEFDDDSQEDVCKVPREFWGNYNLEEKNLKNKYM